VKKKVEKQVVEEAIVNVSSDPKNEPNAEQEVKPEKKIVITTGKMKPNPKWTY